MDQPANCEQARSLRVLLIGNYVPDHQQSMQRYTRELAQGLEQLGVKVTVTSPPQVFFKLSRVLPRASKILGNLDKYIIFPLKLVRFRREFDVVHITDHSNAIYSHFFKKNLLAITCHDLLAVRGMLGTLHEHRPRLMGRQLQKMILNSLRNCKSMICVSESTARDVQELIRPDLLTVIPNAIRDELGHLPPKDVDMALESVGVRKPFFLHVGGNQFYKNRPGVVRVFDAIASHPDYREHRLILAGKIPDDSLKAAIAKARYKDRISVIVAPEDKVIEALYTRATALLFLSTAEGFGWPIVEAQACGCIVATADRDPMMKIGGKSAILINPTDEVDAARRIIAGLESSHVRREEGLRNAARYRSDMVFGEYLRFYLQM